MSSALSSACCPAGIAHLGARRASPRCAAASRPAPLLRLRVSASAAGAGSANGGGEAQRRVNPDVFGRLERLISDNASSSSSTGGGGAGAPPPGSQGSFSQVEGAWVLRPPPEVAPIGIVHFVGGAFVGASPQFTYNLFLTKLAARGLVVITTPIVTGFDYLRIADEAAFKFGRAMRVLGFSDEAGDVALPVWGMGHSLGALLQILINSRYATDRAGVALLSYNNRPVTEAIPLFSPLISPMMQGLGPILQGLAASPMRFPLEIALNQLRGLSPPAVRDLLPLLEQLRPLYADLASGRADFSPSKEETARLVRSYYAQRKNLLVRFQVRGRGGGGDLQAVAGGALGRSAVRIFLALGASLGACPRTCVGAA